MRYIDKSIQRDSFNEYTRQYLHDCWNDTDACFIPKLGSLDSYRGFSHKKYKLNPLRNNSPFNGWLDILMQEHERLCCYCMRRLAPSEVSVEHLVPESFSGLNEADEIAFYERYVSEIRRHVMLGGEMDRLAEEEGTVDIDALTRMPHLVAHSNLFPACDNKIGCSCNNHRGNRRILPMMLMEDVDTWVAYNDDGSVSILHADIESTQNTLKYLDLDSGTLKSIRHLWYLFSRIKVCPADDHKYYMPEVDGLLRQALDVEPTALLPSEYNIFLNFDKKTRESYYWNLFLKYDWFYGYYSTKYPL